MCALCWIAIMQRALAALSSLAWTPCSARRATRCAWQTPPPSRISWPRWRGAGERRTIQPRGSRRRARRAAVLAARVRGGARRCTDDACEESHAAARGGDGTAARARARRRGDAAAAAAAANNGSRRGAVSGRGGKRRFPWKSASPGLWGGTGAQTQRAALYTFARAGVVIGRQRGLLPFSSLSHLLAPPPPCVRLCVCLCTGCALLVSSMCLQFDPKG